MKIEILSMPEDMKWEDRDINIVEQANISHFSRLH